MMIKAMTTTTATTATTPPMMAVVLSDSAVVDDAAVDDALVDGAVVDGAVVDGAVVDGAVHTVGVVKAERGKTEQDSKYSSSLIKGRNIRTLVALLYLRNNKHALITSCTLSLHLLVVLLFSFILCCKVFRLTLALLLLTCADPSKTK